LSFVGFNIYNFLTAKLGTFQLLLTLPIITDNCCCMYSFG